MTVAVPPVSRIEIRYRQCVIGHDVRIDLIPVHMKECHVQHIEEAPVLRCGIGMGEARKEIGYGISLALLIGIPEHLAAHIEPYDQSTGLHRLLEGPVGIRITGDSLHILIGACILNALLLGTAPQDVEPVVVPYIDPVQCKKRILRYQDRRYEE